MNRLNRPSILPALALLLVATARADDQWVVYQGDDGPGHGKKWS